MNEMKAKEFPGEIFRMCLLLSRSGGGEATCRLKISMNNLGRKVMGHFQELVTYDSLIGS